MKQNNHNPLYEDFEARLNNLKARGLYRRLPSIENRRGKYITREGKEYLNLSSNDYLGLAGDESLFEEFRNTLPEGTINTRDMTSSSSRLLTGNHQLNSRLEEDLSNLYGGRPALTFNSGYHANTGILGSLAGKHDVIFSDKLNHASIIDGMKLSGARFYRYPHCDYKTLEKLLQEKRSSYQKAFIVTESLFSMDGDRADLQKLADLKKKYNTFLYVDEAHSAGVYGKNGRGLAEKEGAASEVDILIGTFGKALASLGAYGIFDGILKEYLINTMRPFIFTTGLPPLTVSWSLFIINKLASLDKKREQLAALSRRFHKALAEKQIRTAGDSYIIPIIIGDEEETIQKAAKAREAGYLLFPIRPPTVPPGTSRLRISLTADMEWKDLEGLIDLL